MPTGKKAKPTKRIPIIVVGPGSDGSGSDSPIIITDGSCQIISINDDFHPTPLRSSSVFVIPKSNGGALSVKPDNVKVNAATAGSMAAATVVIVLTDNATNNTLTIQMVPTASGAYFNWAISVTSAMANLPLTRFDMNGGESRIAHPSFNITSGTINVGGVGAANLATPKHFTIHFR